MDDLISRQAAIKEFSCCELTPDGGIDANCAIDLLNQLPSAQPEPPRVNLNKRVKVKLTDLGKDIYYHRCDELNKAYGKEIVKPSFPSEDKDGYTRFQLWEFIQLYGPHIGIGAPNVIDPIDIVFERENQCAN